MRAITFNPATLEKLFEKRTLATLKELKDALGTHVTMTVFRKLKMLAYITSYSHRGQYYALKKKARFNSKGLWSFQLIWFSKFGTLQETARIFVEESSAGYSSAELSEILHVDTKEGLLRLFRANRVFRSRLGGVYVYFSKEGAVRRPHLVHVGANFDLIWRHLGVGFGAQNVGVHVGKMRHVEKVLDDA